MQLNDRDTFTGVDILNLTQEEKVPIISSTMFLKIKQTPQGLFDKLKARLVAGGHLQDREIHNNRSSLTVSTNSVFMIAAIAAMERRSTATIDFPGAFLHALMPKIALQCI